jgi:ribonuclease R
MIHRLLDGYIKARDAGDAAHHRRKKVELKGVPSYEQLVEIGRHISFTERRADDAERELRQVKILELLKERVGEVFTGVVTGITNFGIFVQIQDYLIDGLIRYEDLMDDWWDVDERSGMVRGQRTGQRIGIGDVARVIVVSVDVPRRELNLAVAELLGRGGDASKAPAKGKKEKAKKGRGREHRHAGVDRGRKGGRRRR